MSMLQPYSGTSTHPDGFTRGQSRALQQATNQEIAAGIQRNVRLSVANFLTLNAMQHTAGLVSHAHNLAGGDDYLASRLAALIDGYVAYAHGQITGYYYQQPWQ